MDDLDILIRFLILQHLNQWDPMGFSPGRAEGDTPFDEYLSYACAVQNQLTAVPNTSVERLAKFIAVEFSRAFGETFEADAVLEKVAANILYHIDLLRLNNTKEE